MNANNIPRVKSAIRGVSLARAQSLLSQVLRMDDAEEIHHYLRRTLKHLGLGQLTRPRLPDQQEPAEVDSDDSGVN